MKELGWQGKHVDIEDLLGARVEKVEIKKEYESITQVDIHTDDGVFSIGHIQDCCECVDLIDVDGDLQDLVGGRIVLAEVVGLWNGYDGKWTDGYDSTNRPADLEPAEYESCTWTFMKLGTEKVSLTMRWYGSSNGYYSEHVDIVHHGGTE